MAHESLMLFVAIGWNIIQVQYVENRAMDIQLDDEMS